MLESYPYCGENEVNCPEVVYDKDLLRNDRNLPYEVCVDVQAFGKFLTDQGLEQERIKSTKVLLKRKPKLPQFVSSSEIASFNLVDGNITIFTDRMWKLYMRLNHGIEALLGEEGLTDRLLIRRRRAEKNLNKHLYTRKLPDYLQYAPEERGYTFADDLVFRAVGREASTELLQKTIVLNDRKKAAILVLVPRVAGAQLTGLATALFFDKLLVPMTGQELADNYIKLGASIGVFRGVLNAESRINPIKTGESKIRTNYRNDPQYRQIVSLLPKD